MSHWKENLSVQISTRRAIVLYGNVGDAFFEDTFPESVNITAVVSRRIQQLPQRYEIVVWNPLSGIQTSSSHAKRELQKEVETAYLAPANTRPANASRYDLGDDISTKTPPENALKSPEQFFQFLEKRFSGPQKSGVPYAFILDGTDALFGDSAHLSEKERNQLLMLSRAIRDSDCSLDSVSIQSPGDILLLITEKLGYVGYEEGGQLTNAVRERPFSVLLFDEIEKAHTKILDKFLQILEDGRLTDGKGETVSFSESVIIFTSNIGAAEISPNEPDPQGWFRRRVEDKFRNEMGRPELLNRIGTQNILPFHFLKDPQVMLSIIKSKLRFIREKPREKYQIRELVFDDEERVLLGMLQGYDYTNGGRGVANCLDQYLLDPLAEALFEQDAAGLVGKTLIVSRPDDTLQFSLI